MMRMIGRMLVAASLIVAVGHYSGIGSPVGVSSPVSAASKSKFTIAWSHYTGWEPAEYARHAGILKKWADKYGIEIELKDPMKYTDSFTQYAGGQFDGVFVTNMDALTGPAIGGVDTTAIIIGDFSNGNDGIAVKNGTSVKDLKGRDAYLEAESVSQYALARALYKNSMKESDVRIRNTAEKDILGALEGSKNGAAVTWNPTLMTASQMKGVNIVFTSKEIPGEIIDMLVVRTNAPDALKKALTGAWYETMGIMSGKGTASKQAIAYMAQYAGNTVAEFNAQLATTAMFYSASDAAKFARSPELKKTMELVRTFSFDHGMYGVGAKSKNDVGIAFPDKTVMGNPKNVKLRFDATYMQLAAEGKL